MARFELDADRHVVRLARALRDGRYQPGDPRLKVVRDPKTRLIAAPPIRDRIVHRALLDDIGPTYERGFVDESYAVASDRGVHRAVLRFLRWTRTLRYRLVLDVRRYFPSVRHDTLIALFARRLRDADTIRLIEQLIRYGGWVYRQPLAIAVLGLYADPVPPGCGLPLGGYLSHWSGGLYLDGLDHYVKRVLKIGPMIRYVDDVARFDDDPRRLADARETIAAWLWRERGLQLKRPSAPVVPTRQPATYLGYRISAAGIRPGPKAKRRMRAKLKCAMELGPARLERMLVSYRGLLLRF